MFYLMQCKNKKMVITRKLLFGNFFVKMKDMNSDPNMILIYKDALTNNGTAWNDTLLTEV